jgi:NAD(P)-dependent dehydrogenase (short-subunit alcohol dehydrogenase family)
MPRENGFDSKRVVIVGGSSGIGLAVAEQVALEGAEVVIVSSSAERVQQATKSIGGKARGEVVDVSDEKAVKSFFTKLGPFDHLVFTAGDSLHLHELADTDLKQASSGRTSGKV